MRSCSVDMGYADNLIIPVIGWLLLLVLVITLLIAQAPPRTYTPQTTPAVEVTNEPAGIYYYFNSPPTTALAGYYCIYQAQVANTGWLVNNQGQQTTTLQCTTMPGSCTYQPNPASYHPPGYSIQLNADLSNGLWIQDMYGIAWSSNGTILLEEQVYRSGQALSLTVGPPAGKCGWLIISIRNGVAYFGYSSDGVHVTWYANYTVGNATIEPGFETNLVIAGPGNGAGVNFTNLYVVLSLWYWNGSAWVPAQTYVAGDNPGTLEFVTNAWVYNYNNTAIVTWTKPTNQSVPVPTPEFKP